MIGDQAEIAPIGGRDRGGTGTRLALPASAIAAGLSRMAIGPASAPSGLAASAWVVQGSILLALGASAGKIGAIARGRGLPPWIEAQADRNHRRMIVLSLAGMLLAGVAAIGAGNPARGWALGGLAAGFNLGAIVAGSLSIVGQARLRKAAETRADRLLDATEGRP